MWQFSGFKIRRFFRPPVLSAAELALLFFGNRYQSHTDIVLSDLGVARYYPYSLDRDHRLLLHRPALDEYLHCVAQGDRWRELDEPGNLPAMQALADQVLPPAWNYSWGSS